MKQFINAAVVISFFGTIAADIWAIWDQREIVANVVATALIVFVAVWVFKLIWILIKEL